MSKQNASRIIEESRKLYGLYIGEIVSKVKDDKKKRNRYQVRIHGITPLNTTDKECPFAEIMGFPLQGKKKKSTAFNGMIEKGTFVYIQFLQGDINYPTILGITHGDSDVQDFFKDDISGFETKSGHLFTFNDKEGEEEIVIKHGKKETKINFDKDGNLIIDTEKDLKINVKGDAKIDVKGKTDLTSGNDTTIKASKLKVDCDIECTGKIDADKDISTKMKLNDSLGTLTPHFHTGKPGGSPLPRV